MTGVLANLLMGVAEDADPVKDFEGIITRLADFSLTEDDFIEFWHICSEFLNDATGSFGSLVTLCIVEKLLRQVAMKDRAVWRDLFFEADRKTRIKLLRRLLSKKPEGYAEEAADNMSAALFPILDAITRFKKINVSQEAASILGKRYNIVGNVLQELNDDIMVALKA